MALATTNDNSTARRFIVQWVSTAIALWVAVQIVPGLHVGGGWFDYLLIAIVFGFVNATLGFVTKVLTFPAVILTFGIFILVVNGLMLEVTDALLGSFTVDNFSSAFWGALIISIVSALMRGVIGRPSR